jgi:hypothetical protein
MYRNSRDVWRGRWFECAATVEISRQEGMNPRIYILDHRCDEAFPKRICERWESSEELLHNKSD